MTQVPSETELKTLQAYHNENGVIYVSAIDVYGNPFVKYLKITEALQLAESLLRCVNEVRS